MNQCYQNVGWSIDTGRKREQNEDYAYTVTLSQPTENGERTISIYAVADGMGGHAAGEVASELAVRTAIRRLMDSLTATDDLAVENCQMWMQNAVSSANKTVYKQGGAAMGTTLLIAVVIDNTLHIANIGDSRAYLITRDGIRQLTHDHSLAQMLLDAGALAPEEAVTSTRRNILTRSIGTHETVEVDVFEEHIDQPCYLLLCSDGLWSELSEEKMLHIVHDSDTVQEASQRLVDAGNEAGGHDNIAVVLAQLDPID